VSLAREVELITFAMNAMERRDAPTALRVIRAFERETAGHGQMAEDAAAIEIEALCLEHDRAASAKLDAFDQKWPSSAQRSRLTSKCEP
jgi:hypothetical protein